MLFSCIPLLKKNDTQDAWKREGNTTHIIVFTPSSPVVASFREYRKPSGNYRIPAQGAIKPLLIATDTRI
jgi:hypothetical protein